MDLATTTKQLSRTLNRNSPTILTGLGVAGLITTVIFAIKATKPALEALYQEEQFRRDHYEDDPTLSPEEIFEITWKFYIPTLLMGSTTIACMIGSNHIHLRRNAALASLFSITERTLQEYQKKVVEEIGDKKEEQIRGKIAQDKLNENPINQSTVIMTGKGDVPCYDSFSSRYFMSDVEKIRQAENFFNQRLLQEGWLNINYFYDLLGMDPIELGDEFGWIATRALLETKFTSKMSTDNRPTVVLEYFVKPYHI